MGMNQTPASERVHISFLEKKCRQIQRDQCCHRSESGNCFRYKGTTTDPVYKTMELLPLGPVMVIDTPGIDDEENSVRSGSKRSYQVLNKTDIAVLIIDGTLGQTAEEEALVRRFQEKGIPYLIVYNKLDLMPKNKQEELAASAREIWVSASNHTNIYALKEKLPP